jgi:hypothetical protein
MSGLHRMLLHLAGRMADDWMTHLRRMVGEYELGYLPDTVSGGVATLAVALPAGDIELLRRLQARFAGPEPPAGVDLIPVAAQLPPTAHRFAPAPAGEADEIDPYDTSIAVADTEPAVVAVRRTWRTDPTAATPPTRVYLVEVDPGAPAWAIGEDIVDTLRRSPELRPQIEVYWTGEDLSPYHRAALAGSTPVWQRPADAPPATAEPEPEPARELVYRFVAAARHETFDEMRRLIDWPLTGAPRLALQLAGLDPADRDGYARDTIPGLFTAGDSPERVQRVLWQVVDIVGKHPTVRQPDPAERQDILDQMRVAEVPALGIGADLLARLAELRQRSAQLSEVYLVSGGSLVFPLAWAPGSDRLVLFYE